MASIVSPHSISHLTHSSYKCTKDVSVRWPMIDSDNCVVTIIYKPVLTYLHSDYSSQILVKFWCFYFQECCESCRVLSRRCRRYIRKRRVNPGGWWWWWLGKLWAEHVSMSLYVTVGIRKLRLSALFDNIMFHAHGTKCSINHEVQD